MERYLQDVYDYEINNKKLEGKEFQCPVIFQEKQMTDALKFGNWDILNLV